MATIDVDPVWYAVSVASLRMASRLSRRSLVTFHLYSMILCSVLVKEFARISKKVPTAGAFVHSLVERRAYSCRDMM